MSSIPFHQVPFYGAGRHDRLANDRADEASIAARFGDPDSRFIPVWRDQHLIARPAGGAPAAVTVRRAEFAGGGAGLADLPWCFLGRDDAGWVFSVDLDTLDEPRTVLPPPHGDATFEPLRPVAALLPAEQPALLAQARGMHHWRRQNRFCGVCGAPNVAEQGGHRLGCAEGHQHFPRTDPVVIMLVRHGNKALLARGTRFPPEPRLASALAGFVEPGETAEEAVAREVWEEVGLRVRDVRYVASQPWPFPGSLMLGFHAEADADALRIDPDEIDWARWFTRDEVRTPDPAVLALPDRTAIARLLVDAWLAEQPAEGPAGDPSGD